MGTRMNPLAGRYFNNGGFAQALSNLAGAFAPPDAGDIYAYAQAAGQRDKNARLASLWADAGTDFDRRGVAAGLYTPAQSYYSVDQSNATSRSNNAADNARAMDVARMVDARSGSNNAADNARAIEEAIIGQIGARGRQPVTAGEALPGMDLGQYGGPSLPSLTGAGLGAPADPLTESQVIGQVLQGLPPTDQRAAAMSDVPLEKIVGADGKPVFATGVDAVGQEAYVTPGTPAKAEYFSYQIPGGASGTAVSTPEGGLVDVATRQPLPQGVMTAKLEGGFNDTLGATTANITDANQTDAEAEYGLGRVSEFRTLLQQNPGILGLPGTIRGFAQDIVQAAAEMTQAYGGDGSLRSVEQVRQLAETVAQRRGYDPALAQAHAYALEMAYFMAKSQDPSGEVNVRELERNLSLFDGGMAGNAKVLANLDVLQNQLQQRRDVFAARLRQPNAASAAPAAPAAPAARPRATNAQTGETVEWDGSAWVPVQ